MSEDIKQEEVAGVEIEEKKEPIEIDEVKEVVLDESDPRAAIYARHKEKRSKEKPGAPVGTEEVPPEHEDAPPVVDEMVTVKINGKEKRVSKAKVDEAGGLDIYQKRLAAEENMRLAAEEKRRVQEFELQLNAKAHELQRMEQDIKQRAVQQPASPPPGDGEVKQMAREYHEAMLNGDLDRADELLIKLQGAQKVATPDADAIAKRAAAEAKAALDAERQREQQIRFEQERVEAVQRFEEEFSDIAENPELREWADQKTIKIMRDKPGLSPAQIIDEAARQVREALGRKAPVESSKLDAKRALTNVKGGSARAMPKAAPRPPTNSQYVESLRKQRGLE